MGRPKKIIETADVKSSVPAIQTEVFPAEVSKKPENSSPVLSTNSSDEREKNAELYKRDRFGLLQNIHYKFRPDGSVDWKAMISKEHIVPNEEYFKNRGEPVPETIDGLPDEQLVIKLAGFKEVAKLRGIVSITKDVNRAEYNHAVVTTTVVFIGNYETNFTLLECADTASATAYNTSSWGQYFLETTASNRSFSRAVRNALRIDIVGNDEILNSICDTEQKSSGNPAAPWKVLQDVAAKHIVMSGDKEVKLDSFEKFRDYASSLGFECSNDTKDGKVRWENWKDIPGVFIWQCLKQLNESGKLSHAKPAS